MIIRGKKVQIDGYVFDSGPEARRYGELRMLLRCGEIRALAVHPKWDFSIGLIHVDSYTADFSFVTTNDGTYHCEDVKPFRQSRKTGKWLPILSRDFPLRVKLMLALYQITVEVVM